MRTRHEHQIKRYMEYAPLTRFDHAMRCVLIELGFSWFTDEQIAELRARMIGDAWTRYRFYRDQRRRAA